MRRPNPVGFEGSRCVVETIRKRECLKERGGWVGFATLERLSKIIMCLALAAFAGIVTFDNITDYGSNYTFVRHVLSMDTTIPGNALMYRAIPDPVFWRLAYDFIIAGEAATALLLVVASVTLWRARRASAAEFRHAKRWLHAAATVGFLVWFVGFMVVGGEWFAMWQSQRWNGQEAAFRFYATLLAVLIFVNQPDVEIFDAGRSSAGGDSLADREPP